MLVLGRYPGVYGGLGRYGLQILIGHGVQLGAGKNQIVIATPDTYFLGDCLSRGRVVTGNHHRANSGVPAFSYRGHYLGPRWIHDAVYTEQD